MSQTRKKIAVYPGSFDPITLGHVDIVNRIAKIFDEVIVLVSYSESKTALFSVKERVAMAKQSLKGLKNVKVDSHSGLTIEYAQSKEARILVRGLRAVVDFEYEASMGNVNRAIGPEIETLLVLASPEFYFISSRMVKDVAKNGGDVKSFVPVHVLGPLEKLYKNKKTKNPGSSK
jgi:pantetheine-phosphate adenylyltransferase